MNEITTINVITILIAVGAFILSLYNTWKQHQVRGPEFNLTEARLIERSDLGFTVKILIQNIGDRMGFLRWNTILIKLDNELLNIYGNTEFEWDWQAQPETQILEEFTFGGAVNKDLSNGHFVAFGVYSSHKGKMIDEVYEIPLSGMLRPVL